ncbi:hypothetical protein [Streptomyces sp. NPDC001530]|uniref:hypothetical protein n=1 Tax=Streptomyces sp. NPDC001530 TaxID=3364582 RepID=UPI0036BFA581
MVNIASGDDETRYAALGARPLPGGTVCREPQLDAWSAERHARVLPLVVDARHGIGARGTTLAAYRARVHRAYADKLPGSAYARSGEAAEYGAESPGTDHPRDPESPGPAVVIASSAGALTGAGDSRFRRPRRPPPSTSRTLCRRRR